MKISLVNLVLIVGCTFGSSGFLAPAIAQEAKPIATFKVVASLETNGPNAVFHDLNGDRLPDLFVGRNNFAFGKPEVDHLLFFEAKRVGNSIAYEVKKSTLDLNPNLYILPG